MAVYIIAEAGVNHNGDVSLAKKLIDIAKEAKVDAVKFQTFKSEKIVSKSALMAKYQVENMSVQETQLEMLKKLELSLSEFKVLKEYCDEKGIDFLSTPDDLESLEFLVELGMPLIKVGSTEITNHEYLKEIASKGLPIILSTGMSTLGEVEKALETICSTGNEAVTILHCTTNYPTAYGEVNIKAMCTMETAFKKPVGYSDHTLGNEACIAAVTLGAVVVEKHFTINKEMLGPDHKASLNPEELNDFVECIRRTEQLIGDGIKRPTNSEKKVIKDVRRSIVASKRLEKGIVLTKELLEYKRPGTGISPEYVNLVIGKKLKNPINEDDLLKWEDI